MTPFQDPKVKAVFDAFPAPARGKLLEMRELIFRAARETDGAGTVDECLKWGEPSYLTLRPKSGSTIRIGWKKDMPDHVSVFFHCQTDLIGRAREHYPHTFVFEGNRRMSIPVDKPLPEDELMHCFSMALTYHSSKSKVA